MLPEIRPGAFDPQVANISSLDPNAFLPRPFKELVFDGCNLETWYAAPYPEEYTRHARLYICEFCLKYIKSESMFQKHRVCTRAPAKGGEKRLLQCTGKVLCAQSAGRRDLPRRERLRL